MKRKPWDRLLWGVMRVSGDKDDSQFLLGTYWHNSSFGARYPGEPTRVLLFETRDAARAWCAERNAKLAAHKDFVGRWRYVVVRARERVEPVEA